MQMGTIMHAVTHYKLIGVCMYAGKHSSADRHISHQFNEQNDDKDLMMSQADNYVNTTLSTCMPVLIL